MKVYRAKIDLGKKAPHPGQNSNWELVDTYNRFVRGVWTDPKAPSWGRADLVFERGRSRLKSLPSQAVGGCACEEVGCPSGVVGAGGHGSGDSAAVVGAW